MSCNSIRGPLQRGIVYLEHLKILDLSYSAISRLPTSLYKLYKLESMLLSCNQLAFVSGEIGKLTSLKVWQMAERPAYDVTWRDISSADAACTLHYCRYWISG